MVFFSKRCLLTQGCELREPLPRSEIIKFAAPETRLNYLRVVLCKIVTRLQVIASLLQLQQQIVIGYKIIVQQRKI